LIAKVQEVRGQYSWEQGIMTQDSSCPQNYDRILYLSIMNYNERVKIIVQERIKAISLILSRVNYSCSSEIKWRSTRENYSV